jgi:hypothetical protein
MRVNGVVVPLKHETVKVLSEIPAFDPLGFHPYMPDEMVKTMVLTADDFIRINW